MKVFISQPMRGKTYSHLIAERALIKEKVKADFGNDIEFIDTLFLDGEEVPLKSLSKSLSLLADADGVVFVGQWFMYPGCYIEHECSAIYGVPILKYYSEV